MNKVAKKTKKKPIIHASISDGGNRIFSSQALNVRDSLQDIVKSFFVKYKVSSQLELILLEQCWSSEINLAMFTQSFRINK